jgi:hypothetical protein
MFLSLLQLTLVFWLRKKPVLFNSIPTQCRQHLGYLGFKEEHLGVLPSKSTQGGKEELLSLGCTLGGDRNTGQRRREWEDIPGTEDSMCKGPVTLLERFGDEQSGSVIRGNVGEVSQNRS